MGENFRSWCTSDLWKEKRGRKQDFGEWKSQTTVRIWWRRGAPGHRVPTSRVPCWEEMASPRTVTMFNHGVGDCLGKHGLSSKARMGPKSTASPGYQIIAAKWPVLLEKGPCDTSLQLLYMSMSTWASLKELELEPDILIPGLVFCPLYLETHETIRLPPDGV